MAKQEKSSSAHAFSRLWYGKHVQQNKSGEAAKQAIEALRALDTEDFSNTEVAEAHGEYARIAAVTALSAVKKAKSWEEARVYLHMALDTVLAEYPLGKTEAEAAVRGEYWQPVYGEHWAQLSALMDVLELSKVLVALYPESETFAYFRCVHHALFELVTDSQKTREMLVLMIKHGDFDLAGQAYGEYQAGYGQDTPQFSPDQWITLTTSMIGRYLDAKLFGQAKQLVVELGTVLMHQKGLSFFGVREFFKNISEKQKLVQLDKKMITWYAQGARDDSETRQKLGVLFEHVFVGMGERVVALEQNT